MIETILARGDARVGELLLAAFRRGEIFTAWDVHFHFPVWEELLDQAGRRRFSCRVSPGHGIPLGFHPIEFQQGLPGGGVPAQPGGGVDRPVRPSRTAPPARAACSARRIPSPRSWTSAAAPALTAPGRVPALAPALREKRRPALPVASGDDAVPGTAVAEIRPAIQIQRRVSSAHQNGRPAAVCPSAPRGSPR